MQKSRGFTLTELILVMVILGVLSAVIAPRFFDNKSFTDSFDRADFMSAIAWVRMRSLTTQCSHEIRIDAVGWQVLRDLDCQSTIPEPACILGNEVYNFSVSLDQDLLNVPLAQSQPNASSLYRLIFTPEAKLYVLNAEVATPGASRCTSLSAADLADDLLVSLQPVASSLRLTGETAYVRYE